VAAWWLLEVPQRGNHWSDNVRGEQSDLDEHFGSYGFSFETPTT